MIAIFNTEQRANTFSNKIHAFLLANRIAYNATTWAGVNKSDNEEKWMVKIHPDIDELETHFNLDLPGNNENQIVELVETLPSNWVNEFIL